MVVSIEAVDQNDILTYTMPDRFRHDITYFMSIPGENGVPALGDHEYWIDRASAKAWLDDGVFEVVSPLDSASKTEVELTEEQEGWLEWMVEHDIQRVRIR